MIKRIVSLFVVVCLLLSLFCVTASAVDIYEVDKSSVLMSSAPLSLSDSGISTAAVEPSDLDSYLKYGSYSVAQYLASLKYFFTGSSSPSFTGSSFLTLLRDVYEDFFYGNGYYLSSSGNSSSSGGNNSIAEYLRNGFLGLSTNIKAVTSAIQALNFNDYSSILSSIYSSVDGLESGLTSANTAIGGVTTAVNNVRSSIQTVIAGLTAVNTSLGTVNTSVNTVDSSVNSMSGKLTGFSNASYLGISGQPVTYAAGQQLANINRMGFMGLGSHFRAASGSDVLLSNGTPGQTPADVTYSYLFRYGLLGLRSLLSGSETDNVYSSTLNDNNNTTTTVNSTGLGPLLNTQLSNIGENLGHLAYIFASDDDIKLKQDSKPLVDATDSFFDDSDTKVKASVDNISGIKGIGDDVADYLSPGNTDIGDINAAVNAESTWEWFTSETASNIDTVVTTYSRNSPQIVDSLSNWYSDYWLEVFGRAWED